MPYGDAVTGTPRASLIIPLLRQKDSWLRQAVLSALQQTVTCEVLVVISNETPRSNRDTLSELCSVYPTLQVVERPVGMRFAAALNLGIHTSRAPRIGFLLSDDWLDVRAVELSLPHDADIVSTGLQAYKADGVTRLRHITADWTRTEYERRASLAEKAHYLSYFFLYRRTALEKIGGLDEKLGDSPGIDDWDLPWSLLESGSSVALVEQRLYNCRDHEGERLTTRSHADMTATFLRVLDKHKVEGELRERLIRQNVPGFGRSLQVVYNSAAPWPVRKLREAYRTALPIDVRRGIEDRVLRPIRSVLHRQPLQTSQAAIIGPSDQPFARVWDDGSLARQRLLLARVLDLAKAHDVRLYLYWGTLLGHVREGKILDWDDDVDLALFDHGHEQISRLRRAAKSAGLRTYDHERSRRTMKIFDPMYESKTEHPWTWPFLDIYHYPLVPPRPGRLDVSAPSPRELVLPGRRVFFEGAECWEPEAPLQLLDLQYPDWRTTELAFGYSHRRENWMAEKASRAIQTDKSGRKINPQGSTEEVPDRPYR